MNFVLYAIQIYRDGIITSRNYKILIKDVKQRDEVLDELKSILIERNEKITELEKKV